MMAKDVLGVMDALRIPQAHFLGFSLGGAVAQELAIAHPYRVGRLVLSNSFSRIDLSMRQTLGLWKSMAEKGSMDTFISDLVARIFTPEYLKGRSREVKAFVLAMRAKPPPGFAMVHQIEAIEEHDTYGRLGLIDSPTLVLSAADDFVVPLACGKKLAAGIPHANLQVIPRCGHAVFIEESEIYNLSVLRFLNEEEL